MVNTTHLKALLALLLAGFVGALDLAIIGPALPAIQKVFALNSRARSQSLVAERARLLPFN